MKLWISWLSETARMKSFYFTALITCLMPSILMSADATVTVNMQKTIQTIDGWGDTDVHSGRRTDNEIYSYYNEATTGTNIKELPLNYFCIMVNFYKWENSNDNSDPNNFNWSGFTDDQTAPKAFGDLHRNGIKTLIMEIGLEPTWWTGSSDDEITESIAAMLVKTRDEEKTTIDYLVYQSATKSLIKTSGQRFKQLGLSTKWIVGGGYGAWSGAWDETEIVAYAKPFLDDISLGEYLAPIIGYWSHEDPDTSKLKAVATFAEQYGKKLINTHPYIWPSYNGGSDPLGKYYQLKQWPFAWAVIKNYYKNLKYAHISSSLWGSWGFPLLTGWVYLPPADRAPFWYVLHQLASSFSSGSVVLDATSSSSSIWSLGVKKGTYLGVMVINSSLTSKTVDVNGISDGSYSLTLTDAQNKMASTSTTTASNGKITITMPPQSLIMASNSSAPTSNISPTCLIVSPLNGAILTEPANISVTVNAADADGSITKVSLYKNDVLIRDETGAPYQWNNTSQDNALQNLSAGTYTLKAIATDNSGATTPSTIAITVKSSTTGLLIKPGSIDVRGQGESIVKIVNLRGQVVRSEKILGNRLLNLDNLAPGVYQVFTQSKQGKYFEKFVR